LTEDGQRLLMRRPIPNGAWVSPQQFLAPKIQKFAKKLVHFGLYRWGLLGKLHNCVTKKF